jgi:hypothetical protein
VKLGTENKKKTIIAGTLLVVAAFLLIRAFSGGGEEASAPAQNAAAPAAAGTKAKGRKPARTLLAHSLDPTLRFDLLRSSEDVTYKGNGRNIFSSQAPPPPAPIPTPAAAVNTDNNPPPPPPPPPSGLKFYGYAGPKNGGKKVFLIKGEDIFLAKEGDVVDRRYKIVRVGTTSVEVQDVLTNHTETIPLGAG